MFLGNQNAIGLDKVSRLCIEVAFWRLSFDTFLFITVNTKREKMTTKIIGVFGDVVLNVVAL